MQGIGYGATIISAVSGLLWLLFRGLARNDRYHEAERQEWKRERSELQRERTEWRAERDRYHTQIDELYKRIYSLEARAEAAERGLAALRRSGQVQP